MIGQVVKLWGEIRSLALLGRKGFTVKLRTPYAWMDLTFKAWMTVTVTTKMQFCIAITPLNNLPIRTFLFNLVSSGRWHFVID